MSSAKTYELKDAARGEIRRRGQVVSYDLEAGPVEAKSLHPLVLERLTRNGVAVVKKAPKEE